MTPTADVYAHFDAATRSLDAYAVLHDGKCVGRVVFKHGNSCRCFAQVWNSAMGEGVARGHGFDRPTEAFERAVFNAGRRETPDPEAAEHLRTWRGLFQGDTSAEHWDNRLRRAGYVVQHVV